MLFTQRELEPSQQLPRPFLTLSVLVTSPLQLHRPLSDPHALLSWDLLSFSQTRSSQSLSPPHPHSPVLVLPPLCLFQQIQSPIAIHSSVLSVSPTADSH